MEEFKFNTVEEAIAAIKAGKMVLVTDDEDRENEGDLIMAAELCTPEAVNFNGKIRTRSDLYAGSSGDHG